MPVQLLWHDYRYFPYERRLAEREAGLLFAGSHTELASGIAFTGDLPSDACHRLTYFKAVQSGTSFVIPDQAKLEASGNGNGSAWNAAAQPIPSLRRQSTRYSAHGLHEYRGKFNPQVVRAVGNLFGLAEGSWVLDPFCGSGTTLLEAAHIGWNCFGVDINPLGVLIANAKLAAFNASPEILDREATSLAKRLKATPSRDDWREHLPEPEYLEAWFPRAVLGKLRAILAALDETKPKALSDVFRVILSDVCREVSYQDPGDLRIRRRKKTAGDYPAIELFLESMETRIGAVIRARHHMQPKKGTTQLAVFGDTREVARTVGILLKNRRRDAFDAAITSPPYATAMPYLDTQRLSLALLGLIGSRELRSGEKKLIGNREIADKERLRFESDLETNAGELPEKVITFCRKLRNLANHDSHGFRRRNVPALTYKYLADMAAMFASIREVIKPHGRYALLVGRNMTTLRGREVPIDTPQLLAEVAASRGWRVEEMMPFETYHRYDVHQNNSIREETLLVLRSPGR
jgi:hypothetical protein